MPSDAGQVGLAKEGMQTAQVRSAPLMGGKAISRDEKRTLTSVQTPVS